MSRCVDGHRASQSVSSFSKEDCRLWRSAIHAGSSEAHAKTCATLPWPIRGWSLQFVFSVLTLRSQSEGAGVKAAQHRAQRGLALTQERPEITLRRLPRTENRSGQMQARGA